MNLLIKEDVQACEFCLWQWLSSLGPSAKGIKKHLRGPSLQVSMLISWLPSHFLTIPRDWLDAKMNPPISLSPHTQTFASAEFLKPLCFIYPTPTLNHTHEGWFSAFNEKYRLWCKSTACQLLGVMIHTPMIDIFFPGGCSLWVSGSTMLVFTDSDEKNRCQDEDWKGNGGGLRGCRMTRMERERSPENSETFFWVAELLSFFQPQGGIS